MFGAVEDRKRTLVLEQHRCQICSRPLHGVAVYLVRPADRLAGWTAEPALHEVCFTYTAAACPVLANRKDQHRSTPVSVRHLASPGRTQVTLRNGVVGDYQPGRSAEAYDAWWIPTTQYQLRRSDDGTTVLGLELDGVVPSRVEHVRDAASPDEVDQAYRMVDAFQALMAGPESADPHRPDGRCPAHQEDTTR